MVHGRLQFPLELAHASTVHSCQGITAKSPGGVVFLRRNENKPLFAPGLCYVALSRCQSIHDLVLHDPLSLDHFNAHKDVLQKVGQEYERLESAFPQKVSSAELRRQRKLILNM